MAGVTVETSISTEDAPIVDAADTLGETGPIVKILGPAAISAVPPTLVRDCMVISLPMTARSRLTSVDRL